ncbi:unnamed protein product [Periconia digitata]|uniref:Uncharacterized protein n=1 Tax=Periconia digitata TaxID=1303443 RepID=A0A9W4UEK3_9PLEO|nr:unnamed protein product [Periconia digitata]
MSAAISIFGLLVWSLSLTQARLVKPAADIYFWTITDWYTKLTTDTRTVEYHFIAYAPYDGEHPNVGQGSSHRPAFTQLCTGNVTGTPLVSDWKACTPQGPHEEKSSFAARVIQDKGESRIVMALIWEARDYSGYVCCSASILLGTRVGRVADRSQTCEDVQSYFVECHGWVGESELSEV